MFHFLKTRRFRYGAVATAVTIIVIAIVIVFNMVVSALSSKYPLSVDLTANKVFGISAETETLLASLNKDVQIVVCNSEEKFLAGGQYYIQVNEVIKKYARQSPRISIKYIDITRSPNTKNNYPDLQLTTSSIIVSCGEKYTGLIIDDLYNIERDMTGRGRAASSKAEQTMTSAILKVSTDKLVGVSMLTGHGETPLLGLESLLTVNNFEVTEQNLLTERINPDNQLAVLCAPMRDLGDDELKKLDDYLDNDGKYGNTLLYFASDLQPDLPKLGAFLADWGISVSEGVVFESSENRIMQWDPFMPIVDYNEDVYSKSVLDSGIYTLVPYAKPMSVLFDAKSGVIVYTLLSFSQSSGVFPPDAPEDWRPTEFDITGPIPALILAQNSAYDGTTPVRSNVVACGSFLAVEDSYISAPSIGNGEYFLNLINTLTERTDVVSIQAKALGGGELAIQSEQALILGLLFVIIIPLAVLIAGIAIWFSRRHR